MDKKTESGNYSIDPQEFMNYVAHETNKVLDMFSSSGGDDIFRQFTQSWTELATRSLEDPTVWIRAITDYQQAHFNLWRNLLNGNTSESPVAQPEKGDRRFQGEEWSTNPIYDYIKQSYLLTSRMLVDMAANAKLAPGDQRRRVRRNKKTERDQMRRPATEREAQAQSDPNHPPHDTPDEPISNGKLIALIAGPVVAAILFFLPAPPDMPTEAWHLVAVAAWMVIWWLTEAIPLAATALLPIVLLPIFVSDAAWLRQEWLDTGLQTWQTEPFCFARDFFLPLLDPTLQGVTRRRARYIDSAGFSAALLRSLPDGSGSTEPRHSLTVPEHRARTSEHMRDGF